MLSDGCNQCTCGPNGEAGCTKKFCTQELPAAGSCERRCDGYRVPNEAGTHLCACKGGQVSDECEAVGEGRCAAANAVEHCEEYGQQCVPDEKQCFAPPCPQWKCAKRSASGPACGCDGEQCASGKTCVNNVCQAIDTSPFVADGAPGCLRFGGECCGENLATCGDGQLCHENQCVDKAVCNGDKPKMCGCDATPCSSGEECVDNVCRKIDTSPFVADGAPGCLRFGGECCGRNRATCADGQICHENKCIDQSECDAPKPPPTNQCTTCKDGVESYFDGCNSCTCGPNGVAACTEKACITLWTGEHSCELKCDGYKITKKDGTKCACKNGAIDESTCDAPKPPPTDQCTTCEDGVESYFDGCNTCRCGANGEAACTKKACIELWTGEHSCELKCDGYKITKKDGTKCACKDGAIDESTCDAPKPPTDQCTTCEDGVESYFDGCNTCRCGANGEAACTKKACIELWTGEDSCELKCDGYKITKEDGTTCTCKNGEEDKSTCVIEGSVDGTDNGKEACGCDASPCASGHVCRDNMCLKIDTSPFIADGAPGCLRIGGECCGESMATCSDGQVCHDNKCIDKAECEDEPTATKPSDSSEPGKGECKTCASGVESYFDGCNTCTCDPDTGVAACTELACVQVVPDPNSCNQQCDGHVVRDDEFGECECKNGKINASTCDDSILDDSSANSAVAVGATAIVATVALF